MIGHIRPQIFGDEPKGTAIPRQRVRPQLQLHHLSRIEEKLRLLNPQTILARGFSIVTNEDGVLMQCVDDLEAGTTYYLHLKDGKVGIRLD